MSTNRLHQNNFGTNLTSNQIAGVTTTPLNSIPSVAAPFSIALDATNLNSKYEIVEVTSKTATHINHAATTYAHTTAEEVRMVVGATELDETAAFVNTTVKASGAEVTTGTDDAKFATPKALKDADVNTRLKSKVISSTRDLTAANGNVAYTGVGFVPTSILCFYGIEASVFGGQGFVDSAKAAYSKRIDTGAVGAYSANLISMSSAAGGFQEATVATFDADGFTLTWVKTSSPTGTCQLKFLCFR